MPPILASALASLLRTMRELPGATTTWSFEPGHTEAEFRAIRDAAVTAFEVTQCAGLARIDFFLTDAGTSTVTEVTVDNNLKGKVVKVRYIGNIFIPGWGSSPVMSAIPSTRRHCYP